MSDEKTPIQKRGTEFDLGDMARAIAERTGFPAATLRSAVEKIAEILPGALAEHGRVELPFGTFFLEDRAQRRGYNFETDEEMTIPPRQQICFNPATKVRKAVTEISGKQTY